MDDAPQLLPNLNPRLNNALIDSLRVLRQHATDAKVREWITDVLDGRGSLRDLARDGGFGALVEPLATRGWQHWEAMDPDERDEMIARSRSIIDQQT